MVVVVDIVIVAVVAETHCKRVKDRKSDRERKRLRERERERERLSEK